MWPGSQKHTVKEGMMEIDPERLGIIQSVEMGNVAWKSKRHSQRKNDRDWSGNTWYYSVTTVNRKCGLEVGNIVKEGMIEIDQEILDIIQSLGIGNLAWKWKTHSERRDDRDRSGKAWFYVVTGNGKCGLEVENTQSKMG